MKNILILTGILMILPFTISHGQIEPDPSQLVGPVTNIDDLNRGHSIITQLMTDHANGNFERFEDQVITITYVDPDNGTLVVGFDPIMHVLDIQPNTGNLLDGITTKIVYAFHELLSNNQDPLQRYHDLYEHRCVNSNSIFCEKLANELNISQTQDSPPDNPTQRYYDLYNHRCTNNSSILCEKLAYNLDINQLQNQQESPNYPTIFFDNFENGLKKWSKSGDRNFKPKISDEASRYPSEWPSNNKVLESGKCDTCSLSLKQNLDITQYTIVLLGFYLYVDELNPNRYLQLDLYNGTNWNAYERWTSTLNNNTWSIVIINLTNHKTDNFNLRFTVDSGKNKEIAIENFIILGELDSDRDGVSNIHDKCPQVFGTKSDGCPDEAPKFYDGFSGHYNYIRNDKFFYPIIAIDKEDGVIPITCNPPSGSILQSLGVTSIYKTATTTCTTTDSSNNNVTKTFNFNYKETQHVDLYGGMLHTFNNLRDHGFLLTVEKTIKGTITIGAETTNGTKGIVVAGHSVGYNANKNRFPTIYHLDHFVEVNGKYQQIGFGPAVDSKNFSVDAAFIPLQTSVDINPYQVKMKNGTVFTVTQSSMAETPRLAMINAYGQYTNDQGRLLFKNVTKVDGNNIYNNMGIFTSNVISGDSGGPIIYHNDNKHKLIGSIHGATCVIHDILNLGNITRIDLTNIKSLCNDDTDYYYYKVFTPWEYIKRDLKIK